MQKKVITEGKNTDHEAWLLNFKLIFPVDISNIFYYN